MFTSNRIVQLPAPFDPSYTYRVVYDRVEAYHDDIVRRVPNVGALAVQWEGGNPLQCELCVVCLVDGLPSWVCRPMQPEECPLIIETVIADLRLTEDEKDAWCYEPNV